MSRSSHADSLRVLHLIKGLGPGGAERLIINQLATTQGGFEYAIAYRVPEKTHLVSTAESLGASTHLLDSRPLPVAIRGLVRSVKPAVIHVHSPLLAVTARVLKAARQIDAPILTTEHNRWPRHHPLTRAANRVTAPLDDARIAVSEDVRTSMSASIAETTRSLDHGVPLEAIRESREARDRLRQEILGDQHERLFVVGIVANFRPEKAYDVFLDATKRCLDARDDVHFVIVGQGPGEESFRQQVRALNTDRVHVLGFRDDATDVMATFDLFTLTSRHEGKPVSLMEAFALGLPVVATKAGGIPEAVNDGENGLLVDIDDAEAVAKSWVSVAEDSSLRQRLAAGATASAASFDASSATRSIEGLYRELAARP